MRYKVWVVGSLNHFVQELEEELAQDCNVQIAGADYSTLNQLMSVTSPELMLIYMNNLPWEKRDELAKFIAENAVLKTRPIIVAGTTTDNEAFQKILPNHPIMYVERPISARRIQKIIMTRLKEEYGLTQAEQKEGSDKPVNVSLDDMLDNPSLSLNKPTMPENQDGKKKHHILAVDDNIVLLRNIKTALEGEYRVTIAKTGVAALTIIGRDRPDLILLDYEMPLSDGKQVLEMIRSDPAISSIPVFFLTGVTDSQRIKEVLALHPQGYLLKSTGNQMIVKRLKEFFDE